jgi:hypothetical protein
MTFLRSIGSPESLPATVNSENHPNLYSIAKNELPTDVTAEGLASTLKRTAQCLRNSDAGAEATPDTGLRSSFQKFCQRAWWKRLWVFQEFLVNRNVFFQCGDRVEHSAAILAGMRHLISRTDSDSDYDGVLRLFPDVRTSNQINFRIQRYAEYHDQAPNQHSPTSWNLLALILGLEGALCSDPRDKIFGVSGLAKDDLVASNLPDYSLSTKDVYKRLASSYLCTSKSLDILNCCNSLSTPSWVPDWTLGLPRVLIRRRIAGYVSAFHASGNLTAETSIDASDVLAVTGIRLSVILLVDKHMMLEMHNQVSESAFLFGYQAVWKKIKPEIPNFSQTDFWLALTAELRTTGLRMSPAEMDQFRSDMSRLSSEMNTGYPTPSIPWQLIQHSAGRRIFVSQDGNFGLAPASAQEGDQLCVLFGGQTPFVLRKIAEREFIMIGEAFMTNMMDGQAIEGWKAGKFEKETFRIL